tara:strand:- start:99 stop:341 length:243 start_codon:yes stop_codon:yes gene_type:complete
MFEINTIIGIIGMGFILVAFVLDEFIKKFNQDTEFYNVLNIIGAAFLIYYAYSLRAWPFVALNIVWFAVAGAKLIRITQK